MKKLKRRIYTDGSLEYGKNTPIKDDRKKIIGHEFTPADHVLRYEKMSEREQDVEFANQLGKKLDLKVKCPDDHAISNDDAVKIGGSMYEIVKLDRSDGEVYLYLSTADSKG